MSPIKKSSEWSRVSDKVNTVLKTSTRTNDPPNPSKSHSTEFVDFNPEVKALTDYRCLDGTDQYLVTWYGRFQDTKVSWEYEHIVERKCMDALLKFWLATVFSENTNPRSSLHGNGDLLKSVKNTFVKKLKLWAENPPSSCGSQFDTEICSSFHTPSKKRPRLQDDDLSGVNRESKAKAIKYETDSQPCVTSKSEEKDSSDSDDSESSTIPPSETETSDFHDEKLHMDATCQTDIELDPFACAYCQSRKGEDKRLSSLRKRNNDKKESQETKSKETQKKVQPEPVEPNEEEDDDDMVSIEYEVEKIVNYRKAEVTNIDEYYIRWKGFTAHYDTWEPLENLSSCDNKLITFYVERVGERKALETEMSKNPKEKKNPLPALPPIPEIIMDKIIAVAPVTDEEIEMAFKNSLKLARTRVNGRWNKKKLRKMLFDLIGESFAVNKTLATAAAQDELPNIRHQLLMLEGERKKELVWRDLKEWENQLNIIARGKPEIVVENNFDLAGPPSDFKYINDNILGEGVQFPPEALEGCDCEESCTKDKSKCCPGKHDKVVAYNIYKRLRVFPGYPIYECNKRCKCGPDCANRVVQDGTVSLLGTKLCIFRTSNDRGWGVKTLKKIKRGTFVCLYAGEIITFEEAEERGKVYEKQLGASYLFDLDYYADGNNDICTYTIDATKMGNVAHFINHSCEPNLSVFNVWADCVDQNLPKLAFFALRDIEKDEELTYDYGTAQDNDTPNTSLLSPSKAPLPLPEISEMDDESDDFMIPLTSSPSKNRLKLATSSGARRPCLCGTQSCRKTLF